ncbi:ABC transporter ATP-binding protein [Alkalicella caledoniensis]|uniref:ABC transporter ATP-binding protein n=1 Tax=Alkalicella caledoniensis TaxID=2731377 RepID=A0A7G9WB07_ALKCA|nr:ABC transporter ATP-binding protein [Alkalicella caledoniensis]QNO15869.1 ABC transporter ATP-binding protein [Alkalicella caledoniensis]
MNKVIEVKNLVREYDSAKGIIKKENVKIQALKGISFDVNKGEIFGLLGQNGAGKTTTIKILTTLLAPTSGEAEVLGYKSFGEEKQLRPLINFIFGGERGLYWRLSARDNLTYFSDLYKVDKKTRQKRIPELLELVGLSDRADEKVETYSKGMKQRLMIARGLVNDPEVIFMDEPTIGLDPVGARDLRKIIRNLSSLGKTIMLTTHYMFEADELCDRIAIINKGELAALDTPMNLKSINSGFSVMEVKVIGVTPDKINKIRSLEGIENVFVSQQELLQVLQIQCSNCSDMTPKVMNILKDNKTLGINIREATLEDAYLNLVGGVTA